MQTISEDEVEEETPNEEQVSKMGYTPKTLEQNNGLNTV